MTKMKHNRLKDTQAIWIPKIPEYWDLIKVRHLFKETTIKGFPDEPLLVASQEHGVVNKNVFGKRTMEATKDFHLLKLVEEGDFVISLRSFQGGIELAHQRGIISPAYTILKERTPINKRYFKHLFKSKPFISLMTLCVKGIRDGQNIDYPTFKNEYLPFPPIEEQEKIGAYLDRKTQQIQEFIQKKERLIELLEEKLNKFIYSVLIEGTLDKQTTQNTNSFLQPNAPLSWQRYRLKHLCSKPITGQWGEDAKGDKNDIICIRVADYKNLGLSDEGHTIRNINKSDRLQLKNNDLLIEKSGGGEKTPVGRVVKFDLPINAVTSNFISKFSALTEIITPDYLLQIFNCLNIVRYNVRSIKQTTGIQNLDIDHFFSNKLYIPSIERQKELLLEINNLKTKTEFLTQKAFSEIELAKEYQESLITQVVSGQLKVPEKAYPNVHYKEFDMVAEQGSSYHT